jgi:hypothetical protein
MTGCVPRSLTVGLWELLATSESHPLRALVDFLERSRLQESPDCEPLWISWRGRGFKKAPDFGKFEGLPSSSGYRLPSDRWRRRPAYCGAPHH